MYNTNAFLGYYDLLCTNCVQKRYAADTDGYFLLRVSDHARVRWNEVKPTRLEEQMEEMETRINVGVAR